SSVAGEVRPGATGVPVPGYDCRVVDEEGREVPRGTPGLIAIKGPTGCKYWRKPERQAEYVRFGGWNVTGDVYVHDDDGYFTYQCRSDDMVGTGGAPDPGPGRGARAGRAPGRRRVGRRGGAGRDARVCAEGLRGPPPGLHGHRRAGERAPGPRQEGARPLQVSPPGRVRPGAPAHGDGQAPPSRAPAAGGWARHGALTPPFPERGARPRSSPTGIPGSGPHGPGRRRDGRQEGDDRRNHSDPHRAP